VMGAADGQNAGVAMTFQKIPLAQHDVSDVDSGSLKRSVSDQIAKVMNDLAALPDRRVLVKCKGLARPFLLDIHDVTDSYVERYGEKMNPEVKAQQWDTLLKKLHATHPYYFVPRETAGSAGELDQLAGERIKGLAGELKEAGDLFDE